MVLAEFLIFIRYNDMIFFLNGFLKQKNIFFAVIHILLQIYGCLDLIIYIRVHLTQNVAVIFAKNVCITAKKNQKAIYSKNPTIIPNKDWHVKSVCQWNTRTGLSLQITIPEYKAGGAFESP